MDEEFIVILCTKIKNIVDIDFTTTKERERRFEAVEINFVIARQFSGGTFTLDFDARK